MYTVVATEAKDITSTFIDVPIYRVHALILIYFLITSITSHTSRIELHSSVARNTFLFHFRSPHYACPEVIRVSVFLWCW